MCDRGDCFARDGAECKATYQNPPGDCAGCAFYKSMSRHLSDQRDARMRCKALHIRWFAQRVEPKSENERREYMREYKREYRKKKAEEVGNE